jgi:hypothetical protein
MGLFELLNIQHFVLYLFPAFITVLLMAMALGFLRFHRKDSEQRLGRITHRYPSDIEERNAPMPLILLLVILGTVLWGFGYIIMTGVLGVKI